jgi:beta-mannosidase
LTVQREIRRLPSISLILIAVWVNAAAMAATGAPVATVAANEAPAIGAGVSWPMPPENVDELRARMKEIRARYEPFLRSLAAAEKRPQTPLSGPWRAKFEVFQAGNGKRPAAPDWNRADLDDSAWEPATVPQWRYRGVGRIPASCILWYRTRFAAPRPQPGRRVFVVFGGVDWEAEVWLNGRFLGRHLGYCEPFRLDASDAIRERNVLAVRVIAGPLYGEPVAFWSILPDVPSREDQCYTRDPQRSVPGFRYPSYHLGGGFGIHREVALETAAAAAVTGVFARADLRAGKADVSVESDATSAGPRTLAMDIVPENFVGAAFHTSVEVNLPHGPGRVVLSVAMPGAKLWSPEAPNLYRCRAVLRGRDGSSNGRDALFGCRTFEMVSPGNPHPGLREGMFLLNGHPLLLRGTNLSPAVNLFWYWGRPAKVLDTILLLKAANYNAVRVCQHVSFPEVRELFDRLGMLSEQDQGGGNMGIPVSPGDMAKAAVPLARATYNNPGVVLLSVANENHFDPREPVEAIQAVDPQRIMKPISGNAVSRVPPPGYPLPQALWNHVIDDFHRYAGWYVEPGRIWNLSQLYPAARLVTTGEYGAEGLDAYETMAEHYPPQFGPIPAETDDALCGQVQVAKADGRQIIGFRGRKPANLAEYIAASQTYQADVLAEVTKGYRLSPRYVGGYFQFHFIDGLPATWPKSIVSHDFRPKKAYYEMAQVNQPVLPLFQLTNKGRAMDVYVANDLPRALRDCTVRWSIRRDGPPLLEGSQRADVAALDAIRVATADLAAIGDDAAVVHVALSLDDAAGRRIASYRREIFLKAWRLEDAILPRKQPPAKRKENLLKAAAKPAAGTAK